MTECEGCCNQKRTRQLFPHERDFMVKKCYYYYHHYRRVTVGQPQECSPNAYKLYDDDSLQQK